MPGFVKLMPDHYTIIFRLARAYNLPWYADLDNCEYSNSVLRMALRQRSRWQA